MTRIDCTFDHELPRYVVIDGAYCETCRRDAASVARRFRFPIELCVECIRGNGYWCSRCNTNAFRWTQAVPA